MLSRWCGGRRFAPRAQGAGMGVARGARRRVVTDVFVALVRACSMPLLVAGKIHHLSKLVPSFLQVDFAPAPTYSQFPRPLCSHSKVSHVFAKGQGFRVRSQSLVGLGSHSKASRAFAQLGVMQAHLRFLVVPCRVFVDGVMIPVSPRLPRALYLHLKAYRAFVGVGKLAPSPRFLPALYSHSKAVLSSSGS
jgi:hypothetical protein